MKNHARFRQLIAGAARLTGRDGNREARVRDAGGRLLADLVGHDDGPPDATERSARP